MNVQHGKWYERNAWILLFVMGVLLVVVGASYIAIGLPERPVHEAAFREGRVYAPPLLEQAQPQLSIMFGQVVRSWGIFELGFGIFVMATTWFRFRKGDRWAWGVLWLLPVVMLAELLNVLWAGMILGPLPIFVLVSVLGLVLPYRQFFRYRHEQTAGQPVRIV